MPQRVAIGGLRVNWETRQLADGEDLPVPPTIDSPAIQGEISEALKPLGYAKGAG